MKSNSLYCLVLSPDRITEATVPLSPGAAAEHFLIRWDVQVVFASDRDFWRSSGSSARSRSQAVKLLTLEMPAGWGHERKSFTEIQDLAPEGESPCACISWKCLASFYSLVLDMWMHTCQTYPQWLNPDRLMHVLKSHDAFQVYVYVCIYVCVCVCIGVPYSHFSLRQYVLLRLFFLDTVLEPSICYLYSVVSVLIQALGKIQCYLACVPLASGSNSSSF